MLFRYQKRYEGPSDEQAVSAFAREAGVCPLTARILAARGIDTLQRYEQYVGVDLDGIYDPYLLSDMQQAVDCIDQALADDKRITLYGDYDVDGVSAIAVLVQAFAQLGKDVNWYIPSRHREGYGINADAVRTLADTTDLLITVDCGSTNVEEIALAYELGMEVIVTDHHECPEKLPACAAVVNPKRPGSQYPFAGLCGTGVAGKLVQALGGVDMLLEVIDLVALATVADIVPLQDENRLFVKLGLQRMEEQPRVGIQALKESAGIRESLRAYHLGFQLGPRINAGGRMELAHKSAELLQCEEPARAAELARQLERDNLERQATCAAILDEAVALLEQGFDYENRRCIVLYRPHWNAGVVGIVAARLAERYHRPTVLFGQGDEGCYGSARSVPGVHIYEALQNCQDLLLRFGGHEQAAGCAIAEPNIALLAQRLNQHLRAVYADELFLPVRQYDAACTPGELDLGLARELKLMEPCGYGNPRPVLLLRGAKMDALQLLSQGKHLKFTLQGAALQGIAFGQGHLAAALKAQSDGCDLLFAPDINTYGGRERLQLKVDHIRLPQDDMPAVDAARWQINLVEQLGADARGGPPTTLTRDAWERSLCEDMAKSPWGTIVLCHSQQSLLRVHTLLKDGCAGNFYTESGTLLKCAGGENVLVAAPEADKLPLGRYTRLYLDENLLHEDYARALQAQLNSGGLCYIMKYQPPKDCLLEQLAAMDRDALLDVYRGLKAATLQGTACKGPEDFWFLSCPPWQTRLALMIFQQLGLVKPVSCPPWWRMEEGKKSSLQHSAVFLRLEQWKGGANYESEG
ncbi:MAG: single-stranded-DNA-specific exonuclease RecJ [Eubacteriales bacterium]|nr:single-stranded-DNA-specific exonuclease RecJ [Eubacteriales bacterium]